MSPGASWQYSSLHAWPGAKQLLARWVAYASAVAIFTGCSAPIISDPSDPKEGSPTGSVAPFESFLPKNGSPIKLIVLHGVGDHCPNYALGNNGWLSAKASGMTALRPQGAPSDAARVYSKDFLDIAERDDAAFLTIVKQSFLHRTSMQTDIPIEAIEISWSPLTQWIKTKQLRYDVSSDLKDSQLDCVEWPDNPSFPAPARALVNGYIKEQVLDRSLADAALYMGSYGRVLQRGVADALCRALTDVTTAGACAWGRAVPDKRTQYIFLTHSLGSRIVYDTLLGLLGSPSGEIDNAFSKAEQAQAKPFVQHMMANTPVVYMMANQLTLLGLAKVRLEATSRDAPGAYAPMVAENEQSQDAGPERCSNSLSAFGQARSAALSAARAVPSGGTVDGEHPVLTVVAFSDTNDLLSWAIPNWYVRTVPGDGCMPNIKVTNVFVRNTTAWLGLFEDPGAAHTSYFENQQVWDVLRCGAKAGILQKC